MDLDILDSKLELKSFISSISSLSSIELMNNSKELLKKFTELYRAATGDKEWPISFYYVFFEMSKEDYQSKEGYRSISFIDREWFNKVELREDMICSVGIDVPLQGGYVFLSYLLTACGSSHVMDKVPFSMVRIFLAPECFSEFNTPLMDLLRELDIA